MQYRAFLCFDPYDRRVAQRLYRWLTKYRMPRTVVGRVGPLGPVTASLTPIFGPASSHRENDQDAEDHMTALRGAATLVVLCSPRAARSHAVHEQILAFKRLGGNRPILCLILEGEPNGSDKPGMEEAECFATALRYRLSDDGNLSDTRAEPIAADMRTGKDGRADAWLKIAAGIAGVGFDELKQRELRRRLKWMRAVAGAAIAVLCAAAGLAGAAVLSQREAMVQRVAARDSQREAEQSQAAAEEAQRIADTRRRHAKTVLDNQCNALLAIKQHDTTSGGVLGLRARAADLLKVFEISAKAASAETPKAEDAALLVVVARSMNALRQHEAALRCLDSGAEIMARLGKQPSADTRSLHSLETAIQLERAAAMLALGRLEEASNEIAAVRQPLGDPSAAAEPAALEAVVLAADIDLKRGKPDEAARDYQAILDAAGSGDPVSRSFAPRAELGMAQVMLARGDLHEAETRLHSIESRGLASLSRSGSLHNVYGALAAKLVESGDGTAAARLLEESIDIANKTSGDMPIHITPQLLSLADACEPDDPSRARRCREQAIAICAAHLATLLDPKIVEPWLPAYGPRITEIFEVMTKPFLPALQAVTTEQHLVAEGPDATLSAVAVLDLFDAFVGSVLASFERRSQTSAELKEIVKKVRSSKTKGSREIASIKASALGVATRADEAPQPSGVEPTDRPQPKGTLTNSIGMKLVPIQPGEFLMGSPAGEPGAVAEEERQHAVVISKPFLMGMHEVTQAQFTAVLGRNPSRFQGDDLPVDHVSWIDANEFCSRLSELPQEREAKRTYRLPTEAEWEYCCRAGTTSTFNAGPTLRPSQARFAFVGRITPKATSRVGSYPPNAWGLHDMHGNVWEWTNDWFSANAYATGGRVVDPQGPRDGTHHTLRGGSASVLANECRSAVRGEAPTDAPGSDNTARYAFLGDFGLRVACDHTPAVEGDSEGTEP
jgi:formylglycine-generating enzyme required for sulfatase activity